MRIVLQKARSDNVILRTKISYVNLAVSLVLWLLLPRYFDNLGFTARQCYAYTYLLVLSICVLITVVAVLLRKWK